MALGKQQRWARYWFLYPSGIPPGHPVGRLGCSSQRLGFDLAIWVNQWMEALSPLILVTFSLWLVFSRLCTSVLCVEVSGAHRLWVRWLLWSGSQTQPAGCFVFLQIEFDQIRVHLFYIVYLCCLLAGMTKWSTDIIHTANIMVTVIWLLADNVCLWFYWNVILIT